MTIQELALCAVESMIDYGYKPITAWWTYENNLSHIVKMHTDCGANSIKEDIVNEYAEIAKKKYESGEISYNNMRFRVNAAERFLEFAAIGIWARPKLENRIHLNPYYEGLAHQLIPALTEANGWGASTQSMYAGNIRRHFEWLEQNGFDTLEEVDEKILREYLVRCVSIYSGQTVVCRRGQLKKSYVYLYQQGIIGSSMEKAFRFRIPVSKKILLPVPQEETAKVLASIDRSTPVGKRDFAIILLAAITGLRQSDIAELKLPDIDWTVGEIRIVQKKTGQVLTLPLTTDVGEALMDYILNGRVTALGRPQYGDEHVFLTTIAPYKAFECHKSIGHIYTSRRKKAGFHQNNGIHALRRAVGRDMITAGIPITTVSQVLGHKNIDASIPYIAVDTVNLKECALSLEGIEPQGGHFDV